MFGSKKETNPKNSLNPSNTKSLSLNTLVKGTAIEGIIKADSDIRIDGSIKGTLECGAKVIIGPTGYVDGEVKCVNAVIEGKFEGNLSVAETLSLKESAVINGDASYDKLVVQQGAVINAAIRRNNQVAQKNTAKPIIDPKEVVKKQTEKKKSSSNKNAHAVLKYSGMAFQMLIIIAIGVFIGKKLDEYFALETPYLTILFIILSLPIALYTSLKDLL